MELQLFAKVMHQYLDPSLCDFEDNTTETM